MLINFNLSVRCEACRESVGCMKRTQHRELRDAAHYWECCAWHFQGIADMECCDASQSLADIAFRVVDLYERAARFEITVLEAKAEVESQTRWYNRAFENLDEGSRGHAEWIIPKLVPVFRKLWRGRS